MKKTAKKAAKKAVVKKVTEKAAVKKATKKAVKPTKTLSAFKKGDYCLLRASDGSVHFGIVEAVDGPLTILKDAKKVWQWKGANTLREVAESGFLVNNWSEVNKAVALADLPTTIEYLKPSATCVKCLAEGKWNE